MDAVDAFNYIPRLLGCHQVIDHMNPAEDQNVFFYLNLTRNIGSQSFVTSAYLTRFQRAPEGAGQSTGGRRHDVIDRRRVLLGNRIGVSSVVPGDCAMHAKDDGLSLRR